MVTTKILNGIEVDGSVTADEFVGSLKGNATSATTAATASKLSSNAGSATKPIYFENGVPKVTTYELNKTVPADAKFTDTTYSAKSGGGLDLNGTEFSVKTGFTESGRNYAVVKDAAGDLYVSVPWTDTTDYTKLSNRPTIPSKTSELTNDSGFITKAIADLTNYYTKTETYTKTEVNNLISAKLVFSVVSSLPASGDANTIYLVPAASSETGNEKDEYIWVNSKWELIGSTKFQLTITQNASGISINNTALQASSATQAGLMTKDQASKLAGIAAGAEVNVNADWNAASGDAQILNKPSLATVATSGSYNDLSNKPTIPAAQVNSDWNATSGKAQILNKPSLATVATSGSYNDLSNKPTITDTKNTAGATDTSSKIYLIGATAQGANPQTYSQDTAYVGTDGCLYSGGTKVLTAHQSLSNYVTKTGSEALTNKTYNGYTLGAACAKAVDTTVASGSASLITSGGVYTALSGKQSKHTTATVTIAASDWSNSACTKTVTGVTASNTVFVSPAPASFSDYATAGVYCSAQAAGTLTFTCSKAPTASITVNVVIMD